MLAFLCSMGGFFVGGGAVVIYAKATGQTLEWRRKALIRWIVFIINGTPPTENIPGRSETFRGLGGSHSLGGGYRG